MKQTIRDHIRDRTRSRVCVSFLLLLLVVAVMPAWGAQKSSESAVRIVVAHTAVVGGDRLYLGDLAQISAPAFIRQELAELELGDAPKPGQMVSLTGKRVREMIYAKPLVDSTMAVEVPDHVFVKRKSQHLSEDDVRDHFEHFLSATMGYQNFEVTSFRCQGLDTYPAGDLSLVVDKQYLRNSNGRFSLYMDVLVNGTKQDRINVRAKVSVFQSVACAARPLKRGEQVTLSDVTFEDRNIFDFRKGVLDSIAPVSRMTLKFDLGKGECLNTGMFKRTPLIRKGDVVKLMAQKNRLSIVTLGVSREDGYADESVQVENMTSGKVVRGLVKARDRVDVLF